MLGMSGSKWQNMVEDSSRYMQSSHLGGQLRLPAPVWVFLPRRLRQPQAVHAL